MPNKTIYVKEADLQVLDQAQEQLGDSVSSMFAEFLRERIAKMTPVERNIVDLINHIAQKREGLKRERGLPAFLDALYGEVEIYAEKALEGMRAGEIRKAKIFWYASNSYRELAERNVKDTRELTEKIRKMLG